MAILGINWKDGNWKESGGAVTNWKDPTGWRLTFTEVAPGIYIPVFRPRRR